MSAVTGGSGSLTLKGRVQTIAVPVKVTAAGGRNVFDGSFVISRKAFGIGDPTWNDVIEDQVNVRFHLVNASQSK